MLSYQSNSKQCTKQGLSQTKGKPPKKNGEIKGTFKLAIFWGVERFYCELDLLHFSINIKLFIMNKKFTTLVASALLAIGSFSGNAAGIPSLDLGVNTGLYQLQAGDKFLAIENDSLKLLTTPGDLTLNTLWCVEV
ncbi:hypothetical protein [Parabacteroides sp.]|nr:hypothetical protein [Parabacteroides sp.]